jgi:hypothetical protein
MVRNAYWLSPRGDIIEVSKLHIDSILEHPTKFGETKKSIDDAYNKYNEPRGVEGKAREEIMLRVINRGFIRVRNPGTRSNQRWSVQLRRITPKVNDILFDWANKMIQSKHPMGKYAEVDIHQLSKGDKMTKTDINSIASGENIKENKEYTDVKIYTEEDLKDFPRWVDYAHNIDPECLSEQAKIDILAHRFRG